VQLVDPDLGTCHHGMAICLLSGGRGGRNALRRGWCC
jgi:hypothetical protein